MVFHEVLMDGKPIAAGAEERLLPQLHVSTLHRLHIHVSAGRHPVAGLTVRILFGTPLDDTVLLADSTVWFEDGPHERNFTYTAARNDGSTGVVMSVPVVAPMLYDVILTNHSNDPKEELYVTVLGQET